jgi:hypothetical protein
MSVVSVAGDGSSVEMRSRVDVQEESAESQAAHWQAVRDGMEPYQRGQLEMLEGEIMRLEVQLNEMYFRKKQMIGEVALRAKGL